MTLGAGPSLRGLLSPLRTAPSFWLRPDSGVFTGGSRTLKASDKSAFIGTVRNTTRIAGVDFWVSLWVNPTAVSGYQYLFWDGGNNNVRGFHILLNGANIELSLSSGTGIVTGNSTGTVTAGAWSHIVVTADRDGNATFYINGAVAGTLIISSLNGNSLITAGTRYPTVACNDVIGDSFLGGSISQIGYGEGYVPTQADVTALYNNGNGLTYAEVEARGGSLATSLISNASRTGFYYNCNETDPTAGLIDQAGTLDLTRTGAELLTNTGFETRTGVTGASLAAGDKSNFEAADAAAFNLGTGDFVLNANEYRTSVGTNQTICGKYQDANNRWRWFINSSNYLEFVSLVGGTIVMNLVASTTALSSTTTKYHCQLVVDRNNIANCKMYVNGVSQDFSLSPYSVEQLSNTGFETAGAGGADIFANWSEVVSGGSATITDETTTVDTGSHAVKFNRTADNTYSLVQQNGILKANAKYTMTARVKSNAGSATFKFMLDNSTGDSASKTTTNAYATYTHTAISANSGATGIITYGGTDPLYVDNISCKPHIHILDTTTSLDNTGKFYVGQSGVATYYHDGRIAMLGIGKPADVTAAAVATAITNTAGTGGLGQYYNEQSSADKTALAWSVFYDLTESSGTRRNFVNPGTNDLSEVLATNLVTNGEMTTDTDWTKGTGWTVDNADSNVAAVDGSQTTFSNLAQAVAVTAGRNYTVAGDVTITADYLRVYVGNTSSAANWTTTGSKTSTITASGSASVLFTAGADTIATLDNVVLRPSSIPCHSDADVFGGWTEATAGFSRIDIETVSPQAGNLSMRYFKDAALSACYSTQSVLTVGSAYTITAFVKSTYTSCYIYLGSTAISLTGLNSSFAEKTVSGVCAGSATFLIGSGDSPSSTTTFDTVSCKSAAIAVGNGPAEAVARNTGSGSNLDGTLMGFTAAQKVTAYSSNTPDGSYSSTVANQGSAGTAYDGVMTGFADVRASHDNDIPSVLAGKITHSLRLDGVNDYIKMPTGSLDMPGSYITFSMWCKSSAALSGEVHLINIGGQRIIAWRGESSNKLAYKNGGVWGDFGSTPNDGDWHHIVVSLHGTTATIYEDGALSGGLSFCEMTDYITYDSTSAVAIGAAHDGASAFYSGLIADVRMYTSALSTDQIAELGSGSEATGATPVLKAIGYDVPRSVPSCAGGYSLTFDGSDDRVTFGTDPVGSGALTISAWIKLSGWGDGGLGRIFDNGKSNLLVKNAALSFVSDASTNADSAAGSLSLGVWLHVAVTRTAAGVTNLYVNGAASGTANQNSGTPAASTTTPMLGNRAALDRAFNGLIDDVRIYNSVLSPAQIAELYAGSEATGATPVLHIGFDEGPFGQPSDGDAVWGWESQEGNRYQLVNGTAANRVVHRLTGINGCPAEEGDGANDIMRVASITGMCITNPTIGIVCKPDDVILASPANQALIAVQDEASANNFLWAGISTDGKFTIQGNNAGTAFSVTASTVLSDATTYILVAKWDGSNWQLYINGITQTVARAGTEVTPATLTGLDSTTLFGRYSNATASNWFDGKIAEPFVDTLTDIRMFQLTRHWKRRYGIS
jgi:hypothetical protein